MLAIPALQKQKQKQENVLFTGSQSNLTGKFQANGRLSKMREMAFFTMTPKRVFWPSHTCTYTCAHMCTEYMKSK